MKGKETTRIVQNAAHYTSPEIRMYETILEIAELQNENRIRALFVAVSMMMLMIRIRLKTAITELIKISSAERKIR